MFCDCSGDGGDGTQPKSDGNFIVAGGKSAEKIDGENEVIAPLAT